MELLLVAALIALLRWAAGRFSAPDEAEAAPPSPPVAAPRRARRPRPPAPAAPPEAREGPVATPPPAPLPAPVPSVARRAPSAHARDFATRAALRRAVVAREVLGPPLSLR